MNFRELTYSVRTWIYSTFGPSYAQDPDLGVRPFIEEAVELAQAIGLTETQVTKIVQRVFAKPKGTVEEELGDVTLTLLSLGAACKASLPELCQASILKGWGKQKLVREKWLKLRPRLNPEYNIWFERQPCPTCGQPFRGCACPAAAVSKENAPPKWIDQEST